MGGTSHSEVVIDIGEISLEGDLAIPADACGIVAFAHGSGSSRFSRRNQDVARRLNDAGIGTLLFDLLSADESERDVLTARYRFDIPLLARRLTQAVDWLVREPATRDLPVGLFGASTGAAAALMTAAERPARVKAVVSRGGRPDLAGDLLSQVLAPTLLIVGGDDAPVITLNRQAAAELACPHQLVIVAGATHLFEEPGALEQVAKLAADWFRRHLGPTQRLPGASAGPIGRRLPP